MYAYSAIAAAISPPAMHPKAKESLIPRTFDPLGSVKAAGDFHIEKGSPPYNEEPLEVSVVFIWLIVQEASKPVPNSVEK